ncbi:Uu.00g002260.m01.CDS01 [Anthostomella pinea]|uniref:Uu.00g002260.m01.CDS01 n=1 Tax=Anthostomella pinea TaxID=933095 RepID=A0AAI8VJI3_9PEZI|nr:Uu.00g002260.m01.CDS01 [Anthostomella pinea]
MIANASGPFLYSQTAHADLNGSVWDTSAEGAQNFHGEDDFGFSYGQITPTGQDQNDAMDEMTSKWIATEHGLPSAAEPMRRASSRSSAGSHRNRSVKTSSQKSRPRMMPSVSQGSHMSHFDMAGNPQMDAYLLPDSSDVHSVSSKMYYPALPMSVGLPTDGISYSPAVLAPGMTHQHVDPAQMQLSFEANMAGNSPTTSWGSLSPVESRMSSPGVHDDAWSLAAVPMDASPTHTNDSSPVMNGMSPSRKMEMMSAEDHNGLVLSDDMFALPPSFTRRPGGDNESTARDHPLYKNAYPKTDGLFHCPWEGDSSCNHKPEKLKCNYDKFVDSHLKPYRCKAEACENARFSSTACLLRHEREAHAMHGHGDKPYLCTYEGCDRAVMGNGFPRQWNLRDHMRRVHNDNGSSLHGSSPSAHGSSHSTKGRKRKNKDADSSSSARKHASRSAQAAEAAAAAARAAEQPMIDEWYQHQKALQSYLQDYNTPDAFDYLQTMTEARDHMEAMGKISKKLLLTKKPALAQEAYGRSHRHYSG